MYKVNNLGDKVKSGQINLDWHEIVWNQIWRQIEVNADFQNR